MYKILLSYCQTPWNQTVTKKDLVFLYFYSLSLHSKSWCCSYCFSHSIVVLLFTHNHAWCFFFCRSFISFAFTPLLDPITFLYLFLNICISVFIGVIYMSVYRSKHTSGIFSMKNKCRQVNQNFQFPPKKH